MQKEANTTYSPGLFQSMKRLTRESTEDGITGVQTFEVNQVVGHFDEVAYHFGALFGLLH